MCDVTRDLQTPPFLQTAICTFSETPHFPGGVKYFMHGCKTFITRHSVNQKRSELISPRMRAAIIQELCLCWPLRLDTFCTWKNYSCHLSSRRDDLRQSCLLTQAFYISIYIAPIQGNYS